MIQINKNVTPTVAPDVRAHRSVKRTDK